MSNFLAIATVTAALRKGLQSTLNADLSDVDVKVTHVRPDASGDGALPDTGVNIFLYQVTPNATQRNNDLPTRTADGRVVQRPTAALDLHYLLTFYGSETKLEPQRVLGSVVRSMHARPVLFRNLIQQVLEDDDFTFLAKSDLANAIETVKLTPEALSLEELSKLWSVFFQTPYVLSVAYQASVVLIEAREAPQPVLPVKTRGIFIEPSVEAAPSIAPNELPGLALWLKSDAEVTYDRDGVSQWTDQSGNENHAIQSDSDRRPRFVADGPGGKPALRFDGENDYLAIQNLSYSASGEIGEITIYALVRSQTAQRQIIASFDRSEYWRLALKDGGNQDIGWDTTDSTGSTDDLRSTEGYTDGRWHLICGWFAAGASPDKRIFVDGAEIAATTAHGGNALGTGNTTRFGFIGVGSEADTFDGTTGPNAFLAGDLVELLICHRALSDEQRRGLERYFMDRYRP